MIDLKTLLIPEILLSPHYGEARADSPISADSAEAAFAGTPYERSFLNYLVLTHEQDKLPSAWRAETLVLYNRYYWFRQFAQLHSEQHGKDAGIEQQAFQILEGSTADIDWAVVEAIDKRIRGDAV